MTVTTDFPGDALPDGWTVESRTGAGTVAVADSLVTVTIPAGTALDSVANTSSGDDTCGIVHLVPDHGGAIDVAVQLDTDITDIGGLGLNLLFRGDGGPAASSMFRAGWYKPSSTTSYTPRIYGYSRSGGSGAQITNSNLSTFMSGIPAWLRVTYDGTGTWSIMHSPDGASWSTTHTATRAFTPLTFKVGVSTAAGAVTKPVQVNQVVDLLAVGNADLRAVPLAERQETIVSTFTGGSATIPAEWADESIGGASIAKVGSAWRFTDVGNATTRGASSARLRFTGAKCQEWSYFLRFRYNTTNSACYFTPGMSDADNGWRDQYIPAGDGYGQEIQSGLAKRTIEFTGRNVGNVVVAPGDSSTGLDETPYTWLSDLSRDNPGTSATWCLRLERRASEDGHLRFRSKMWQEAAGEPEWGGPATYFDGQTERHTAPMGPSVSLSRNALTDTLCDLDLLEATFARLDPATVEPGGSVEFVRRGGVLVAVVAERVRRGGVLV